MAKRTTITLQLFNCVKQLIAGGAKNDEICDYLQIGHATVSRIKSADSYEEYKHIQAVAGYAYRKRKMEEAQKQNEEELKKLKEEQQNAPEPVKQTVTAVIDKSTINYQTNRVVEEMRQMNQHLKLISEKLAFIVEQLA